MKTRRKRTQSLKERLKSKKLSSEESKSRPRNICFRLKSKSKYSSISLPHLIRHLQHQTDPLREYRCRNWLRGFEFGNGRNLDVSLQSTRCPRECGGTATTPTIKKFLLPTTSPKHQIAMRINFRSLRNVNSPQVANAASNFTRSAAHQNWVAYLGRGVVR